MTQLPAIDIVILVTYFAVVLGIGFWFSRSRKNSTDYFLAGRNVGWIAVGASLFATNISSEHFIGLSGSGAATGLPIGHFEWLACLIVLLLGWVFVPFYHRSKVFTMPEFLERRYNRACRTYLTTISIVAYILTKIAVSLYAGALLLRFTLGWDFYTSAIVIVVITGVYTIAGGLAAVIYTEVMQAVVLIGGAAMLTIIGLGEVGGFAGLRSELPADFFDMIRPMSDPDFPWTGVFLGAPILGIWYWCTDQVIVQRTLSARGIADARMGTIFAGYLKILPVFILVLPGLVSRVLYPNVVGDEAFPNLVVNLLPPGLTGIMVAAMLAAVMSSLSATFNSSSTLITMDFYKRYRPDASERRLVTVGRLSTVVMVLLGILWVPFMKNISDQLFIYLQSVQAYISPPIAAVFLLGVFWTRVNGTGAYAALLTGFGLGSVRFVLEVRNGMQPLEMAWARALVDINFLHYAVIMFLLCTGVLVAVSLSTPAPPRAQLAGLTFATADDAGAAEPESAAMRRVSIFLSIALVVILFSLWFHFR
ncbi:MAG TPA: sodium:solute symporter [Thermoanaerobaculia bacterium]|nr:sodium:solute symporter [Thermoanaerobaculia bacterium]